MTNRRSTNFVCCSDLSELAKIAGDAAIGIQGHTLVDTIAWSFMASFDGGNDAVTNIGGPLSQPVYGVDGYLLDPTGYFSPSRFDPDGQTPFVDQHGQALPGVRAWTGSDHLGFPSDPLDLYSWATYGLMGGGLSTGGLALGVEEAGDLLPMYVVSQQLTAGSPPVVPLPGAVSLGVLGLATWSVTHRKRRT